MAAATDGCAAFAGQAIELTKDPEAQGRIRDVVNQQCLSFPDNVKTCLMKASTFEQTGPCLDQLDQLAGVTFREAVASAMLDCQTVAENTHWGDSVRKILGAAEDNDDWIAPSTVVKDAMILECKAAHWPHDMLACASAATDPWSCLKDKRPAFDQRLARVTELWRQAAAHKSDSSIACAKAATAYYGDAQWTDRLPALDAKARKAAATTARTAMTKECIDKKWSKFIRACIVGSKSDADRIACVDPMWWGYPPALGTIKRICPSFEEAERRGLQCPSLPKHGWDHVTEDVGAERAKLAADPNTKCNNVADDVVKKFQALGCAI